MSTSPSFSCPHCQGAISLDVLMQSSVAAKLQQENQDALRAEREKYNKLLQEQRDTQEAALAEAKNAAQAAANAKAEAEKAIRERQAHLDEEANARVQKLLEAERVKINLQAKSQVSTTITDLEERLQAAESAQAQAIEQETTIRSKLREAENAAKLAKIELDRKLDEEKQAAERAGFERASAEAQRQNETLAHQNATLQSQIAELQRKATQGSQQAQGERLELQIEEMLTDLFPMDKVEEVKKGIHGADVLQRVLTPAGKLLGTIVWETKNAQHWKDAWVDKLKTDTREANGQIGVLVSNSLPEGCRGVQVREGLVICDVKVADGIAATVRSLVVEIAHARAASEAKESLQATVYDWVAQKRLFRRLEAVATPLKDMRDSLFKEQATATRLFAARETQIREMAKGIVGICGDMQGMLGEGVPRLPQLEFEE